MSDRDDASSDPDWAPGEGAGAGAAAPAAPDAAAAQGPKYIIGFDPGTVNCGMAVYNRRTRKICLLIRLQFRESRPAGESPNDPGHIKLQFGTLSVLAEYTDIFADGVVFIEDQPPLYAKVIADAQRQTRAEVRAVQLTIQTFCMVQGVRVHAVSAMSYKQFMGHVMPHYDQDATEDDRSIRSDKQKELDRRNAIKWCRANLPTTVVDTYEKSTRNQKKDDAYEAAILALYVADVWFNDDGTMRDERRPLARRKKTDVHPRGRPSMRKPKAGITKKRAIALAGITLHAATADKTKKAKATTE